jgi:hypothetical protein
VSDDPLRRLLGVLSGGALDVELPADGLGPESFIRELATLWELDVDETAPASVFSAAWPDDA